MKTKIVITGSNGLLGQKLVYLLKSRKDVKIFALARGENRLTDQQGYTYESIDIGVKEEVEKVMAKLQPDIIINTAAMTNVDICESKREECWTANVDAVKYLVQASEKYNVHLIHVSTDFIFDGTPNIKRERYLEDDFPNPVNYYGDSKLAAESIVKKSNCKWAIARTSLVYGIGVNMSRTNIVLWAKGELEKGKQINVVNDQFRSPTLVEDLAQACVLIADQHADGVFHISGRDYMSIYEMAQQIADFYNFDKSLVKPVATSALKQAAVRPPKTGFVIDKACSVLGYHPHSFEEGIMILDHQMKALHK